MSEIERQAIEVFYELMKNKSEWKIDVFCREYAGALHTTITVQTSKGIKILGFIPWYAEFQIRQYIKNQRIIGIEIYVNDDKIFFNEENYEFKNTVNSFIDEMIEYDLNKDSLKENRKSQKRLKKIFSRINT